jgi:hypothetical protein
MKRAGQSGYALIMLLAALAVGASWFVVSRFDTLGVDYTAASRQRNAQVLNKAKQALVGYVAAQAVKPGEDNPGAFPCPEAPGSFNATNGTDGKAQAPSCTLPAVGRFPWRTIGTDQLVDASGEPLWYVVSPGWSKPGALGTTLINSNSIGQLTVDGIANDAVALIIAPGAAMNSAAAPGCTAWNQTRPLAAPPDWRNYLECENATSPADVTFATSGPSGSFNDQLVRITVADIMPAIEAAIAQRIEREIAPVLKGVYASSTWSLSAANPLFPYPAPFSNPGTSNYQGVGGTASGLLPFNAQSCAADPRCLTIVAWRSPIVASVTQTGGTGSLQVGTTCTLVSPTQAQCQGTYVAIGATQLRMSVRAENVAMGFRDLDPSQMSAEYLSLGWQSTAVTASGAVANDGSADINATATFPGLLSLPISFRITINLATLVDHAILSSTDPAIGWFVRNEWYRLLYYAPAAGHTAAGLPTPSCATGPPSTCLTVTNVAPTGAQRAILILAGRSVNGSARPSAFLADYLEFGNLSGKWERQAVTALLVNAYPDSGAANAYALSPASVLAGTPLQFKAANTNTGASTLNTPATGVKSLVNADGTALAASQIRANAAVQVVYDGTQFMLSRRPFNDRLIVVDSN